MSETAAPCVVSVVMPAYNEEASIEGVILEHVAALTRMADAIPHWEIVCVDDGSTDRTGEILGRLSRRIPRLRVIRQENQGIFGALARGHREAHGDYIYATASDGQWPAENVQPMFAALRGGADLVIGVRTNRREVYTLPRRVISWGFNWLPRLFFGVAVEDAGSVKLGKRQVFQFELISRSPFFEAERIIRARQSKLKVAFVPIRFLPRTTGKERGASLKNVAGSIRDVFRCFWAYRQRVTEP